MAERRRIALVSSFPPSACGIARYAADQEAAFTAGGARVSRVDIEAEDGPFRSARGAARLLRLARAVDELWLQYQVGLYLCPKLRPMEARFVSAHALAAAALRLAPQSFIIVHETNVVAFPERSADLQRRTAAALFFAARTLVFHTEREREAFTRAFFLPRRFQVIGAGAFYRRRLDVTRSEARTRLGLPPTALLFLCIGFFHEGKGFTEFAAAFQSACDAQLLPKNAELAVVTSARNGHADELERARTIIAQLPRVRLREGFISDDDFDLWLIAADRVVAPYRYGFTSSIVARAAAYGTPALIRDVGFLTEQRGPNDVVYGSDDDLPRAFASIVAAA